MRQRQDYFSFTSSFVRGRKCRSNLRKYLVIILASKEVQMEETTKTLKACIVAHQGGVPQDKLDDEYKKFTGSYIPYLSLGFNSLYEYLGSVKELKKHRNENDQLVYKVHDKKISHINKLVEWQKNRPQKSLPQKEPRQPNSYQPNKRKARRTTSKRSKRQKHNYLRSVWDPSSDQGSLSSGEDYELISDDYESIYQEYEHPVQINERAQKLDIIQGPIVNRKLLIGDDFFLQLAIRNIGAEIWRRGPCTALNSGLCQSGLTIKDCLKKLKTVKVLTNKLVIMLGAEDVYRGHSSNKMIREMQELLDYLESQFAYSKSAITLCTIPPLANLSVHCHREKLANFYRFNTWLADQTNASFSDGWDSGLRYNLIDFYTKNTTVLGSTDYKFFQLDARMVSGTSHPYVLWSLRGRRLAMNLLRTG